MGFVRLSIDDTREAWRITLTLVVMDIQQAVSAHVFEASQLIIAIADSRANVGFRADLCFLSFTCRLKLYSC